MAGVEPASFTTRRRGATGVFWQMGMMHLLWTTQIFAVQGPLDRSAVNGASADGFCGANLVYDTDRKDNKCVGDACDASDVDDTNAGCKTTKGAKDQL